VSFPKQLVNTQRNVECVLDAVQDKLVLVLSSEHINVFAESSNCKQSIEV